MKAICLNRAAGAIEIKRAPLAVSRVGRSGVFEGYASIFGLIDLGRDRVARGAFRRTLASRAPVDVKMLWQHDAAAPIGVWLDLAEDPRGLKVVGRLNLDVARAREVHSLMRDGAVDGLSIGFHARKSFTDPRTGVRTLSDVDLWEISIVTFPMLPQARVTAVKIAGDASLWQTNLCRLRWRAAAAGFIRQLRDRDPLQPGH